ncbi:hypothetical protein [Granulicella tundricola]|uniref:DUF429 domain-containing protein n=1 Tax=Granulicella tundricola (strain ATCC BAA-1859 / DSM 23138 / MP5ACTX9) TaxID=1198114 RepID=E8WYK8_GRATM|nr:hypothetical protein [Granulicella tundricola]ADW67606.1 hypothetical protein AciX9_0534 [Granulicella tundricola MP5ACTX9]
MGGSSVGELDRVVAVDWSGDKGPGQRKKIWAGVWTRGAGRTAGGRVTLETGRTRAELTEWLVGLAKETPRMVVGMDCCFSYPSWFLRECGCSTVFEFWEYVAGGCGERWLGTTCAEEERDLRFWGRPHKRPAEFSGPGYASMMRATDWENKVAQGLEGGDPVRAALMKGVQPKSPFQIGGAGAVGTGSLRAMEWLMRLREGGFRVWPFEDFSEGRPLLVEMYTRLLTGPVAKSNPSARKAYLKARKMAEPGLYGGLARSVVVGAEGSEDGFDALVCCLEMVRWQTEFAGLRRATDETLKLEGITWRPGVSS